MTFSPVLVSVTRELARGTEYKERNRNCNVDDDGDNSDTARTLVIRKKGNNNI